MVPGEGEIIDDRQFGFRKQRSKIDAISKITTKILDGFRRKEKTAAIFFKNILIIKEHGNTRTKCLIL